MKFTAITQTKHEGDNSVMREGYTSQAKKALAYAVRTADGIKAVFIHLDIIT